MIKQDITNIIIIKVIYKNSFITSNIVHLVIRLVEFIKKINYKNNQIIKYQLKLLMIVQILMDKKVIKIVIIKFYLFMMA
jgi:hypothetical protein